MSQIVIKFCILIFAFKYMKYVKNIVNNNGLLDILNGKCF